MALRPSNPGKILNCKLNQEMAFLLAAFSWIGIVIPSSLAPVLNHGSRFLAMT